MICTCTLCFCCCLLLLSLLHRRNHRRFVPSMYSIDCCSTNCFLCLPVHEVYCMEVECLVRSTLWRCLLLYERVIRCCVGWRMAMLVFLVFTAFCFSSLNCFYNAFLGSTVALTASSCIPVCPQPLRACAETQAGINPPGRSPPRISLSLYIWLV